MLFLFSGKRKKITFIFCTPMITNENETDDRKYKNGRVKVDLG